MRETAYQVNGDASSSRFDVDIHSASLDKGTQTSCTSNRYGGIRRIVRDHAILTDNMFCYDCHDNNDLLDELHKHGN
jgi:hypothetical protein